MELENFRGKSICYFSILKSHGLLSNNNVFIICVCVYGMKYEIN